MGSHVSFSESATEPESDLPPIPEISQDRPKRQDDYDESVASTGSTESYTEDETTISIEDDVEEATSPDITATPEIIEDLTTVSKPMSTSTPLPETSPLPSVTVFLGAQAHQGNVSNLFASEFNICRYILKIRNYFP